jgi:hypothetical protein
MVTVRSDIYNKKIQILKLKFVYLKKLPARHDKDKVIYKRFLAIHQDPGA